MNTQQLEKEFQQQEIKRLVKRRTRNLAESLAHLIEVSEGRQLVSLIGRGDEYSNIEALQTWVELELKHCGLCQENELDYLYARLFMVLGDYTPSVF